MSEELIHLEGNGDVTIPTVFRKTANLLEKAGHCKNQLYDNAGHYCVVGAMCKVVNDDPLEWQHIRPLVTALAKALSLPAVGSGGATPEWNSVVEWNNADKRTAVEVIEGLRTAADRLEA